MITSNSTYAEIEAQKSLDEKIIQDFLVRKLERDGHKLKKIFKTKPYYTPQQPATFHSHTTNIHWRILQVLMHEEKPTAEERVRGINPNRSLGPISSGDVKVFSCPPKSKECLALIHGSHKT